MSRRRLAVPVEKPVGNLVHDCAYVATQVVETRQDRVDERPQIGGQVTARIALEPAPLTLFGIELGGIFGQPQHVQPRLSGGQRLQAPLAGMGRAVIQHQIDLPPHCLLVRLQQLQIAHEPGGVLCGSHQLDAHAA